MKYLGLASWLVLLVVAGLLCRAYWFVVDCCNLLDWEDYT